MNRNFKKFKKLKKISKKEKNNEIIEQEYQGEQNNSNLELENLVQENNINNPEKLDTNHTLEKDSIFNEILSQIF